MLIFVITVLLFTCVQCQVDLEICLKIKTPAFTYYATTLLPLMILTDCQTTEETFDECIKSGLNNLRPYFKSGLPDYNIAPFDPFHAAEVQQKRSSPFFNYNLILRNVTESGWTVSHVTKLKTDFNQHFIQYTQFFPDKRLNGLYEIEGSFFGAKVNNRGSWNLNLFDFIQTSTVTRKPLRDRQDELVSNPPINLKVEIQSCKKLELHIGHLAGGRTIVENMLDWIINNAWQPGFVVLRPLINDLVSTAFTEIFNSNFQNFPFNQVFSPEK